MTSRNYCFTINNPGDEVLDTTHDLIGYCVYQLEKGEQETPHLQGYVELNKSVRHAALRKLGGLWAKAHYEARQGSQAQAVKYCMKEEGRLAEPVVYGVLAVAGKKRSAEEDLEVLKARLIAGETPDDIVMEDPNVERQYGRVMDRLHNIIRQRSRRTWQPHVIVLVGPAGVGKSRAIHVLEKEKLWVRMLDDGHWFENYVGQEAVLFDDYRCTDPFSMLLRLLDRHPMNIQKRNLSGGQPWLPKRIYITTPDHPDLWYKSIVGEARKQLMRRITTIIDVTKLEYRDVFFAIEKISLLECEQNDYSRPE